MRTPSSVDALFPKTRQSILAATFGEPHRWWYMRELARHLRLTPSSLQRELASLVKGGILHQRREGKHVYFQAATESPIFEELQGLILKTVGLADVIRDVLRPLAGRIEWAFIYGSVARSEERSASDVDLMVIGQVGLADVSSPLRKAERRLNRAVNPTTHTPDEFAGKLKSNNHFIGTVLRSKKLFILGDDREFGSTFGE
jgi:DNA-binding transcriptional ArsR family regulator